MLLPVSAAAEPADESRGLDALVRLVRLGIGAVLVIAVVVLPFRSSDARITIVCNVGLLLAYFGFIWVLGRLVPSPVSLVSLHVHVAAIQPTTLLLATILEDDVVYLTDFGTSSHHTGSFYVAAARFACCGGATLGAIVVGGLRPSRPLRFPAVLEALPPRVVAALLTAGVAAYVLHVALIFVDPSVAPALQWVLRILANALGPLVLFVGVGLRSGSKYARGALLVLVPLSAIQTVAGNRTWALEPFVFIGIAWLALTRIRLRRLVPAALGFAAAASVVMFVGDKLRGGDQAGRTGQAAVARVEEMAEGGAQRRFDGSSGQEFRESTLHRLLRNSTHAVVTHIPEVLDHEPNGLAKLPEDFARDLLPGFYFDGRTRDRSYRNWFLNDLGFMVNWNTSVELSLVADAWYRGGALGAVLIGILVGMLLQATERFARYDLENAPHRIVALLGFAGLSMYFEGRDIVTGMRQLVLLTPVFYSIILALRMLSDSSRDRVDKQAADTYEERWKTNGEFPPPVGWISTSAGRSFSPAHHRRTKRWYDG